MSFVILPSELYSIYIYDWDGNPVCLLYNWSYLEYHQRVNNSWNCQITIECSISDPIATTLRSLKDDYFILVYRTDSETLQRSLVYEGFHLTLVDQITANGNLILNLYSGGYTDLLKRRIVVPYTGQENLTFNGNGETVIKSFVNTQCVVPTDIDRTFDEFSIEMDTSTGDYTEQNFRYTNLYTACTTIADASKIDFGVYGSEPPNKFYFRAKQWWGKDRRSGNTAGNLPVVFDIIYNNINIPILSNNASEEKNYAYVGGTGSAEDRTIREVDDSTAVARTPWNRKEAFVEGGQQDTTDSLETRGLYYLQANRKQQNFTFEIRNTATLRWPRDWGLGDLITASYFNTSFSKHILEISVVVSSASGGLVESISVEMEDV